MWQMDDTPGNGQVNAAEEPRLARVEQLLRAERHATALGPEFRRSVLAAVAQLPSPAVLAPPSAPRALSQLLSTGEKTGVGVVLALLLAWCIPASREWLSWLDLELASLQVQLSLGDAVLSASLLSIALALGGLALVAGVGVYGARHRLIGA